MCFSSSAGSYFGRTGGLLGLYNYEPYDDLQFPSGELTDDGTLMAESWDVSRVRCLSSGNIGRMPSKVSVEACTHLFQSTGSPLKGCFSEVSKKIIKLKIVAVLISKLLLAK